MNDTPLTENTNHLPTQPNNQHLSETLWTVPEVANYLRLTPETVRMMARQYKIPSIKVGKSYRFRIIDIESWLNAQITTASSIQKI